MSKTSTSDRTCHTLRRGLGSGRYAASAQSHGTRDKEVEVLTTKINRRLVELEKDGADVIKVLGKLQTVIGGMLADARKAVGDLSTMEVTRKTYQEASQHLVEVEDEIAMLAASISQWQNSSVDNGDVSSTWSPEPVSSTGGKTEKKLDHGLVVEDLLDFNFNKKPIKALALGGRAVGERFTQEEEERLKTAVKSEPLVEIPDRDGKGSVVMVYNLNPSFMDCDRLFNLLSPYAKVQRIKFLKQTHFRTAMVELYSKEGASRVFTFLNGITIFGKFIKIEPSPKNRVTEFNPKSSPYMPNGGICFKDFSQIQKNFSLYYHSTTIKQAPTRTLYFYQTPKMTNKEFFEIFETLKAPIPYKVMWFQNHDGMGCLQFNSKREALEAICMTNLAIINAPGQRVHLAFTHAREDYQFHSEKLPK